MDIAYGDTLRKPRRLVLEADPSEKYCRYTTCSEQDGIGYHSEGALMTLADWLEWAERFKEDFPYSEIRAVKEAAQALFTEPESWAGFRQRYAETADPWLPHPHVPNAEVSHGEERTLK